jgi:hypothetical protein
MTNEQEFKLRCEILDRYGEDSDEYRAHKYRANAANERIEFGGKVLMGVLLALIVLGNMYFGTGAGGRYIHDTYEFMLEQNY